jgi:hypothetical protein
MTRPFAGILVCAALLAACSSEGLKRSVTLPFAAPEPIVRTYVTPTTRLVHRLAVLPFGYEDESRLVKGSDKEKTVLAAEKILRRSFESELRLLRFEDIPLEEVDAKLKEMPFRPAGSMAPREVRRLADLLGADGVVSAVLTRCSNLTEGVYAETVLEARFWLWNRSGELLWEADHQAAFRGGIYDVGQAVELVVNQLENRNESLAFERQASRLARAVVSTIPVSRLGPEAAASSSKARYAVCPFAVTGEGSAEGASYLSSELSSALIRRGSAVAPSSAFPGLAGEKDFSFARARDLIRQRDPAQTELLILGEVLEWKTVYRFLHSHVACKFQIEIWDARTARRIFVNTYQKALASGLIKGPTGIAAAALTPVTGLDKKRAYQNGWDLVERAADDIASLIRHREKRRITPP